MPDINTYYFAIYDVLLYVYTYNNYYRLLSNFSIKSYYLQMLY